MTRRTRRPKIDDWDIAYSNRLAVRDAAAWLAAATDRSAAFHAGYAGRSDLDLAYAAGPRRTYDVYHPQQDAAGTLVFIHGGYWRALRKEDHRVFAAGSLATGWRVVLIDYPLCPEVRVGDISRLVTTAVEHVLGQIQDGPVVLSGHSAGGQLACYAMTAGSGLSAAARSRIGRVVSLSGVHDIRPLLGTADLNGVLGLDPAEAAAFSPALLVPGAGFELFCVCGEDELPEFRRQNDMLANVWAGLGLATESLECRACNHFTLLDLLEDSSSALTGLLTGRAPHADGHPHS